MSRILFYRQFKLFSCTNLCMFPVIFFNRALGECPVILVVALHKNVSLRTAVKLHQKQGTVELGSPWPFSVWFRWKTVPGEAPSTARIVFVTLGAFKTCRLLTRCSVLLNTFAEFLTQTRSLTGFTTFTAEQDILSLFWKCNKKTKLCLPEKKVLKKPQNNVTVVSCCQLGQTYPP